MKQYITELFAQAMRKISPDEADTVLAGTTLNVTYPQREFGDYASNVALVIYKKFKNPPASSPQSLAEALAQACQQLDQQQDFAAITATAGFVNFTLSHSYLHRRAGEIVLLREKFGQTPDIGAGRTVVVEYFQNNVAKPPHVAHLRSAVIGDALMRILPMLGYRAISDTHVGDWGTQFGILIYAYKTMGNRKTVEQDPIQELNKLYVAVSEQIERDPAIRELGKAEFKKLEDRDPENRELWQWFIKVSLADFERYRQLLGLLPFTLNLGESFYEDKMPAVLQEFADKGLLTTGETGEVYVDLDTQNLGRCILVKSDGATTYHLRDFATYLYRKKEFDFYRNLYAVDIRQAHHFRQLFRVLAMAGYPAETDSELIDFGLMSSPEGPISTRKGTIISLENLITEAEKRALAIIEGKNPELADKQAVAGQVARAAIKYFDLSHNRRTEFVFTWDKALSFEGNTGPYLQYTHARIHGILRKAGRAGVQRQDGAQNLSDAKLQPAEALVLRKLHVFPEVLAAVAEDFLPSALCTYLFELAQEFNSFYQAVPVTQETDPALREFRLTLISATAQVLKNGLSLLGIEAPEEM